MQPTSYNSIAVSSSLHCSLDTARWTFSKIINLKLPTLHIIGWHNLHAVFGGFKIITRKWFIKIINSNVVCLSKRPASSVQRAVYSVFRRYQF
jgi:hypothetical protein